MQERLSWGGGYKTFICKRGLAGGGGGVQGIHMQERFSWGGGGGVQGIHMQVFAEET